MLKRKTKAGRLSKSVVILLVLLGLAISVSTALIGYYRFNRYVEGIYFKETSEICDEIKSYINRSELGTSFAELTQAIKDGTVDEASARIEQTPEYKRVDEAVDSLMHNFDCSSILVYNIDDSLKDAYAENHRQLGETEEQIQAIYSDDLKVAVIYAATVSNEAVDQKKIDDLRPGRMIRFWGADNQENYDYLFSLDSDGEATLRDIVDKNSSPDGKEYVSIATVKNITLDGQTIGFVRVNVSVRIYQELRRNFIATTLYSLVIILIFILIFLYINHRRVLRPLEVITKETSTFVENNNRITEDLKKIKTGDEIETLAESILKLEEDVNTYIEDLQAATAERERIQAELDLATEIQMSMVPQEFPAFPEREEFDIYGYMTPAKEVGGDFFDYFLIDDDHLCFFVADVSGKGVPAALFMANAKTLIHATALPELSADEILNRSNSYLCEHNGGGLFITAWLGIYEIPTGILRYVNAGHEAPVLVKPGGECGEVKNEPELVLAAFDGFPYTAHEIRLGKGDRLFIVTDGVTEAQGDDEVLFGKKRFIRSLERVHSEPLPVMAKSILEDIDEFVKGAEQFDDITILGFEVK